MEEYLSLNFGGYLRQVEISEDVDTSCTFVKNELQ